MTKHEQQHKSWVASLGCQVCLRIHGAHEPGPVELHHFRGGGWGKGSYMTLVGLCYEHHRGTMSIHGMGTKGFDQYYGEKHGFTQKSLLDDILLMKGES